MRPPLLFDYVWKSRLELDIALHLQLAWRIGLIADEAKIAAGYVGADSTEHSTVQDVECIRLKANGKPVGSVEILAN